jgi:hypothetical protein
MVVTATLPPDLPSAVRRDGRVHRYCAEQRRAVTRPFDARADASSQPSLSSTMLPRRSIRSRSGGNVNSSWVTARQISSARARPETRRQPPRRNTSRKNFCGCALHVFELANPRPTRAHRPCSTSNRRHQHADPCRVSSANSPLSSAAQRSERRAAHEPIGPCPSSLDPGQGPER